MPFGILFLYGFLYFHKEIDGGCNHQQAKKRIEQTRTFTSHVADNVSGILGLEEPIPIECGCQDGKQAYHRKNSLYEVMHSHRVSPYFPNGHCVCRLLLLRSSLLQHHPEGLLLLTPAIRESKGRRCRNSLHIPYHILRPVS